MTDNDITGYSLCG